MILSACAFTQNGNQLITRLQETLPDCLVTIRQQNQSLQQWAAWCFERRISLLFVGAAGIAVRTIAPFVQDKITDSPVLVMDETGTYVIPLLSGHLGGANNLARTIAAATGAQAVITTATDVQNRFAVDVFAAENGFFIVNRDGIQKVSSLLVNGKGPVTMWISPAVTLENRQLSPDLELISSSKMPDFAHILITETALPEDQRASRCLINLVPKTLCVGVGCKKGKSFEELRDFLYATMESHSINADLLYSINSIDLKKKEEGLMTLAQYLHVPFTVFSAEALAAIPGSFTESAFVEQTTGVSNVCERAAMAGAGKDATLILNKTSRDGMTLAIAARA